MVALTLGSAQWASAAEPATVKEYALPGRGHLQMAVPRAWLEEVEQPDAAPPTIRFRPAEGKAFLILVTPIWAASPGAPVPGKQELRERMEDGIDQLRNKAAEKDIRLWEFAGASGPGFYFSMTDRSPDAVAFRFVTQGMVRVSELVVAFTILNSEASNALTPAALKMLQSAKQVRE